MHNVEAVQQEKLAKDRNGHDSYRLPATTRYWIHQSMEVVGLLLAIVAIFYAYVQKRESGILLEQTKGVLSSMTTHYVAQFPESMDNITSAIKTTCATLDAMLDVPGYGHYSSPELFYRYHTALVDTATLNLRSRLRLTDCLAKGDLQADLTKESPKVRVLLFSPEDRVDSERGQFHHFRDRMTDKDQKAFLHFFEKNPDLLENQSAAQFLAQAKTEQGYRRFREILLRRHCGYERDLRKNYVQIRYARQQYITRLWIVDKKDAVFSFDHKNVEESAFRSSDVNLLNNFNGIFEAWWKESVPYSEYWDAKRKNPEQKIADMPLATNEDDPIVNVADNACENMAASFMASLK